MSLLTLPSVKPHLKITESVDNTVLQGKLDAAEAYVSRKTAGVGALAATTITEPCNGHASKLLLQYRPVVSLTSITDSGGDELDLSLLALDKAAGIVEALSPLGCSLAFPSGSYSVVYVTGYTSTADIPADLVEAVRLMTQYFYETQRGAARLGTGGSSNSAVNAKDRAADILLDYAQPIVA